MNDFGAFVILNYAVGIIIALLYAVTRAVRNRMNSHRANDWLKQSSTAASTPQTEKNVVVIVSSYKRVHPECLDSIANQQFAGNLSVIVVDDGSPNFQELKAEEYSKYENHPNWTFIYKPRVEGKNGKKKAQQTAIESRQWTEDDYILFLDADSCLAHPYVVAFLAAKLDNPRIGGAGARLEVANPDESWVTSFLVEEYHQTFQSKAVESWYETVTVVSGACSMWKWKVIEEIFDRYLAGPATGDENTLSYLALQANYGTVVVPAAAKTVVPETPKELVEQQVRWLRSDCLYIGKNYRLLRSRKKSFLLFDRTVELFSPLLLLFTAASCVWEWAIAADSSAIQKTILLLFMMAFDAVMSWRTATSDGVDRLRYCLLYPVHVLVFSLIRIWALFTCKREVWITR